MEAVVADGVDFARAQEVVGVRAVRWRSARVGETSRL